LQLAAPVPIARSRYSLKNLVNLAIEAARSSADLAIDTVGPETFTFNEIVALIAHEVGSRSAIVHVPPAIALACAWIVGRAMGDVTLTHDEVRGLMAYVLVSSAPPTAPTRFSEWLHRNANSFGLYYASEIAKP
jgi:hypothetical protein